MSHTRGALGYLQLPTTDVSASIAFYEAVLGWRGEASHASFEAPGLIGQWTTELTPSPNGTVPWYAVDDLFPTLVRVTEHGGTVLAVPVLDQGERWLVEVEDPSGNRLGLVAPATTARSQTMLMVSDVQASSGGTSSCSASPATTVAPTTSGCSRTASSCCSSTTRAPRTITARSATPADRAATGCSSGSAR